MARLKVVFMGTPAFSVPTLEALYASPYEVVAVYCQPPRPKGRGYKEELSPVHQKAEELGIPVFTPKTLRNETAQLEFKALKPDLAIVVAYGLILPKAILDIPSLGCINIHASLLPRWRGAAPLQRAIMAGDDQTGITIMKMDEGLDTGPMLSIGSLPLTLETTTLTLQKELSLMGASLLLETLPSYIEGHLQPLPQPETGITYADKLSKEESQWDWQQPAEVLLRQLRALHPWPGVYFDHAGVPIKVREALLCPDQQGMPGQVLDEQLTIACGKGAIRLMSLQRPGGKWLSSQEFLNGYSLPKGTLLGCPVSN